MEELVKKAMAIYEEKVQAEIKIIRENKDNMIPVAFLDDVAYSLEYEELVEICDPKNAFHDAPEMGPLKEMLKSLEKRAPGKMYTDMTINDLNGQPRKLSDWVGKGQYVMIDFWASWCGPCRAEMPTVKAAYEKYKSKGLEIIGVSLDNTRGSWLSAIEGIGMPWLHVSDLQGWRCSAATLYNVKSIPSCYLVDKNGRIVAKDLRGQQLLSALNNLLGD
jgi:thiol-disulfide isomerase/thioredoxin